MNQLNSLSNDRKECGSYLQEVYSTDWGDDERREYYMRSLDVPCSIGIVPIVDPFFIPVFVNLSPMRDNQSLRPSDIYGAHAIPIGLETATPEVKRIPYCQVMLDALQQTVIPEVPQAEAETVTASSLNVNEITPSLEFFSNDVIYYNNGVIERPRDIAIPNPVSTDAVSIIESDGDPDVELEYRVESGDYHAIQGEREEVICDSLKNYACPVCYDSPISPVSTICGHVFCQKCIKHLFTSNPIAWKCPQCRKPLLPTDYHPLYLP